MTLKGLRKAGQHIRNLLWEILGVIAIVSGVLLTMTILSSGVHLLREEPTATQIPTATATVSPTPPPTVTPVPPSIRVRVTWYGEEFRGGPVYCRGGRYDPDDPTTVAMGADGPPCGSRLRLCSESHCIIATIKDKCGGCGQRHLDLSKGGWEALGRPQSVLMTILEVNHHE